MSSNKESVVLTDAQTKFLASMMQNTKSKPDIDWDAVAAEIKVTAKSAKERYRLMAIQMGWNKKGDSAATDAGPKTPTPKKPAGGVTKTPTPRKSAGGVTKRAGKVGDSAKKKGKTAKAEVKDEEGPASEEEIPAQHGEI